MKWINGITYAIRHPYINTYIRVNIQPTSTLNSSKPRYDSLNVQISTNLLPHLDSILENLDIIPSFNKCIKLESHNEDKKE